MTHPNISNIESGRKEIALSKRRQRGYLKIDATKIQKSWEENQRITNMIVHGPFEPGSLSKDNVKTLSKFDDHNNGKDRVFDKRSNKT